MQFYVVDTGIGICTDDQRRLFSAFEQQSTSTTRQFGGSGLGLSICQNLVDLMQGQIGVDSEVGKGSRFWFTIPLKAAAPQTADALAKMPALTEDAQPGKRLTLSHILVAEDNATNQLVIRALLDQLGYRATLVENGEQAVQELENADHDYDLVLMDYEMPVLDGVQATRKIRAYEQQQRRLAIPIIALTAHAMEQQTRDCLDAGMNAVLTKPIDRQALQACMAKFSLMVD